MKYLLTIFLSCLLVSFSISEDSNSDLVLELNESNYYDDKRIPCVQLLQVMENKPCCKKLFENIAPTCIAEEFPKEWIAKKNEVNNYAYTECKIACNVRQFPFLGPFNGNELFYIKGTQRIYLKDEITIVDGNIRHEPWHNTWYSFLYEDKTYYISKLNIKK